MSDLSFTDSNQSYVDAFFNNLKKEVFPTVETPFELIKKGDVYTPMGWSRQAIRKNNKGGEWNFELDGHRWSISVKPTYSEHTFTLRIDGKTVCQGGYDLVGYFNYDMDGKPVRYSDMKKQVRKFSGAAHDCYFWIVESYSHLLYGDRNKQSKFSFKDFKFGGSYGLAVLPDAKELYPDFPTVKSLPIAQNISQEKDDKPRGYALVKINGAIVGVHSYNPILEKYKFYPLDVEKLKLYGVVAFEGNSTKDIRKKIRDYYGKSLSINDFATKTKQLLGIEPDPKPDDEIVEKPEETVRVEVYLGGVSPDGDFDVDSLISTLGYTNDVVSVLHDLDLGGDKYFYYIEVDASKREQFLRALMNDEYGKREQWFVMNDGIRVLGAYNNEYRDSSEVKPVVEPTSVFRRTPEITWDDLKVYDFKHHKDFGENGLYFAKIDGGNYYIWQDERGNGAWYLQRSVNGKYKQFSMATSLRDAVADLKKKFGKPAVEPTSVLSAYSPEFDLNEPLRQAYDMGYANGLRNESKSPLDEPEFNNLISNLPNDISVTDMRKLGASYSSGWEKGSVSTDTKPVKSSPTPKEIKAFRKELRQKMTLPKVHTPEQVEESKREINQKVANYFSTWNDLPEKQKGEEVYFVYKSYWGNMEIAFKPLKHAFKQEYTGEFMMRIKFAGDTYKLKVFYGLGLDDSAVQRRNFQLGIPEDTWQHLDAVSIRSTAHARVGKLYKGAGDDGSSVYFWQTEDGVWHHTVLRGMGHDNKSSLFLIRFKNLGTRIFEGGRVRHIGSRQNEWIEEFVFDSVYPFRMPQFKLSTFIAENLDGAMRYNTAQGAMIPEYLTKEDKTRNGELLVFSVNKPNFSQGNQIIELYRFYIDPDQQV